MNPLNKRQIEIINMFITMSLPWSIYDISKEFKTSLRTIKYDIKTIREFLKKIDIDLQNIRGKGYLLNHEDRKVVNNVIQTEFCDEIDINNYLYFIAFERKTKIQDASIFLSYSESSTRKIEKLTLDLLRESVIELTFDKTIGLSYEYPFRKLLVDRIYNQIGNNITNVIIYDMIPVKVKKYITEVDFNYINHYLIELSKEFKVWISSYSFNKLLLYLLISKRRIRQFNEIVDFKAHSDYFVTETFFSKQIIKLIANNINIDNEIQALTDYIIKNGIYLDEGNEFVQISINRIIDGMFKLIDENNYAINKETFKKEIYMHINQFIKRRHLGIIEDINPLLSKIKYNYKKDFSLATKLYKLIQEEFDLEESESEVSYIAIYLFKNAIHINDKKYKVITICGTGRGLAKLLQKRLEIVFNNIHVVENLSSFQIINHKNLDEIDFIVSNVPLPNINKDVIYVSSFLGRDDVNKIKRYMEYDEDFDSIPIIQATDLNNPINYNENQESVLIMAENVRKTILKLYDCLLSLPSSYKVDEESMLGVTIHIIIALPRLIQNQSEYVDFELVKEVEKIEELNPKLKKNLEVFFNYISEIFHVYVDPSEKYAIYQYLIKEVK